MPDISHLVISYFSTALIFLTIDFLWLGVIAKSFYFGALGHLMREKILFPVAFGFYLIFASGLVYFAVWPALQTGSVHEWQTSLINGALFGFFCYATYNLTNISTLKNWPLRMSLVDMAWGTSLSAVSAVGGYFLTIYFIA